MQGRGERSGDVTSGLEGEVRAWVAERYDPGLTLREWWRSLAEAGWAFPTWPAGHGGRGLTPTEARTVARVLTECEVPGPPTGLGQMMGGPVIIDHGTDAQRDAFLFALASGAESWCQLFSEPGAGSDLASLQTRAVRDGDQFVVTGQKVWTSGARTADRAMLVARTDWDVPKHRGITYFICDMDQPGIEVRPLRQMDGGATFNEVFLTEVVVPADRVVGEVNGGWMVAVATLAYERAGIGGRSGGGGIPAGLPGERNGLLDRPVGELLERARRNQAAAAAAAAARSPAAIVDLARRTGRHTDPVVRQDLMRFRALAETHRLNLERARAAAAAGRRPGPEVSTAKLRTSALAHRSRDLTLGLLGASGTLADDDAPDGGRWQRNGLRAHASSIAGGTDEIQRNIIGERVLGLPKEPQVDRDVPFRDLRVGTQRQV